MWGSRAYYLFCFVVTQGRRFSGLSQIPPGILKQTRADNGDWTSRLHLPVVAGKLHTQQALAMNLLALLSNRAFPRSSNERQGSPNIFFGHRQLSPLMDETSQPHLAIESSGSVNVPVMVITGATSGVGEAAVRRFAASHHVIALARTEVALETLRASCGANATNVDIHVCDVSDRNQVENVCSLILKRHAKVDVLINSAGVYKPGPISEMTFDDIDCMIDTNLKGTMYVTKGIVPRMIDHKNGKIIMINSVAGTPTWTSPVESVYCASKHGQTGFANALANELRSHGITVSSIHPGGIDTPMQRNLGTPEEICNDFLTADDVVDAVEYIINANSKVLVKTMNLWGSGFWH